MLQRGCTPEPYIFLKLDGKALPTRGRSWIVRDACSSNMRRSTFFFKIVWGFYGSDLTGFYQSFSKVILKSGSAAGIIEKSRERNAYAQLWDANSTALAQSYPASIGSGGAPSIEMWIIWDGRLLHYGLAGRSQNVLFNLYLIATKIEYKKINIFYSNPLPDLRPDLETSGYSAFTYMFGFPKFQITTELWCLVVWSSQGLDYHTCWIYPVLV